MSPPHCVFISVCHLSPLASQQHLPSLCSYSSQRKAGCEQGSVSGGRGRGSVMSEALPHIALSWSIPAPSTVSLKWILKLVSELA